MSGETLQRLAASGIVWDNHACPPMRAETSFFSRLKRYRDAGVGVVSLNIGFGDMSWDQHVEKVGTLRTWIAAHPCEYRLVSSVADIEACRRDDCLGVVFDVEGMRPVCEDPARVRTLYGLGVRWMLIAYNRNNLAGGGCLDADPGLSAVGRDIIDAMEAAGMVLCLSHTGARTAHDALEHARAPVIFSHSNPDGETRHVRNVGDDLIRRCAATGGVIGLSGIGPFLGAADDSLLITRFVAQMHHLLDLVGPAHVGLGLDFVFDRSNLDRHVRDNPHLFPAETAISGAMPMIAPDDLPAIADALSASGIGDVDLGAIFGGNWLRIARTCWQ